METPAVAIAWQNLNYHKTSYADLKHFGHRQTILRNLHGCFYVNSLNGILGQSGSGVKYVCSFVKLLLNHFIFNCNCRKQPY